MIGPVLPILAIFKVCFSEHISYDIYVYIIYMYTIRILASLIVSEKKPLGLFGSPTSWWRQNPGATACDNPSNFRGRMGSRLYTLYTILYL